MKYNEVANEIIRLIEANKNFSESGILIEQSLNACSTSDILDHLDYAGVIPEIFNHDSTEEKVFAKYCDALLARSLKEIGLEARVLEERADAADVQAVCAEHYSLVGDAKAFRLSRTAKNQKDFKVEALHKWKKGELYACLLAPFYQYPNTESQIYAQAIRYHVTLISYTHLAFLIRHKEFAPEELEQLWQVSSKLVESKEAPPYWTAVNTVVLKLTNKTNEDWERARQETLERLKEQAAEQIKFWQEKKGQYASLDHQTAINLLIKALKIDSKISKIKKTGSIK